MKFTDTTKVGNCFDLLVFTFLLVFSQPVGAQYRCKPRPLLVETSTNGVQFVPAFVYVYRCQGGKRPGAFQCQPSGQTMVKIQAKDFGGQLYNLEISNHTSCREVCVCGRCYGGLMSEPFCDIPTLWNPKKCKCETVFCPSVQGIQSNEINKNNDDDFQGIGYFTVVMLMAIELIVIIIGFAIFKKWREHRKVNITSFKTVSLVNNNSSGINYQSMNNSYVHDT